MYERISVTEISPKSITLIISERLLDAQLSQRGDEGNTDTKPGRLVVYVHHM